MLFFSNSTKYMQTDHQKLRYLAVHVWLHSGDGGSSYPGMAI